MKVSIIIPVYKVEKYLNRCIESVVNQSYQDLEIILVDDGSPDNCPHICDEWASKDNRVIVIHKENEGVAVARNTGIMHATGDYITFIDSDDYINEAFSDFVQQCIESNSEVCYSNILNKLPQQEMKINNVVEKDLKYFVKSGFPISCWGRLFKREFIANNELYFGQTTNAEDLEWSIRIYCKVTSVFISSIKFYNYSQTEGSVSISYKFKNFESMYINICKINNDIDNSKLNNNIKKLIKSYGSNLLYYLIARFGRFEGNKEDYYKLLESNKTIYIKPMGFKYYGIFCLVKVFGVRFATRVCERVFK